MIIGALLEACSIGLVIPVITTLLDPAAVTGDGYLGDIYRFLGMESTGQFTIIMLLAIIAAFVLKNIFLYFQNVIQLRFVYTNQFATSRKMMINFMERPYEYYLNCGHFRDPAQYHLGCEQYVRPDPFLAAADQ